MAEAAKKFVEAGARGFTTRLMTHFEGNADALAEQVQEVMDSVEFLEQWATKCVRMDNRDAPAFSFEEVPSPWRESAIYSMAVAYLMGQYNLGPRHESSNDGPVRYNG